MLSLLVLKLTSTRRVSHGYDIAADPGAVPLNADLDVVLSVLAHTPAPRSGAACPATTPPSPTPSGQAP